MIHAFDHVTLAVRDLEAAIASHQALLGAGPVWRGEHPELGTCGALFGLQNALIELVAPDAHKPEAEALRALVAEREGLQALAFATADASQCSAELRARGVRATPPQAGEALGSDGIARHYRTVELSARTTRGLSVFVVERAANELRPQLPAADDAVHALDHVVIRTADPDAALGLYGQALGIRLALDRTVGGTRMLFFRVGGVTVEVVPDAACGERDQLWGLAYRVRDIDAAHARLHASGFAPSEVRGGKKPQTRVCTLRERTCGVPTLILRDPARE